MEKNGTTKKLLDSYTLPGTSVIIEGGDSVIMRASDPEKLSYVARIESIEVDLEENATVNVRWYYRPEETTRGRRQFHGTNELFLSDHFDPQSASTIERKCFVHTMESYTGLVQRGPDDFYTRFGYKYESGDFTPDSVQVFCTCELPNNPDDTMIQCESCKDWFHTACLDITTEAAKAINNFVCSGCSSNKDVTEPKRPLSVSPKADCEVAPKRRKK